VTGPFFGTRMRGTVAELLGVRNDPAGTTIRATPGPRPRRSAETLAIRRCFREAKRAHAALPPTRIRVGGVYVWRILPAWPAFWVQWLADHPECATPAISGDAGTAGTIAEDRILWTARAEAGDLPIVLTPELRDFESPIIDARNAGRPSLTWRQSVTHAGTTAASLRLRASLDGATWTVIHRQAASGNRSNLTLSVAPGGLAHRTFTLAWTVLEPAAGLSAWALDRILLYNAE
jgi:hypothetical protein